MRKMDPSAAGESSSVIGGVRGSCFGGMILSYTGNRFQEATSRRARKRGPRIGEVRGIPLPNRCQMLPKKSAFWCFIVHLLATTKELKQARKSFVYAHQRDELGGTRARHQRLLAALVTFEISVENRPWRSWGLAARACPLGSPSCGCSSRCDNSNVLLPFSFFGSDGFRHLGFQKLLDDRPYIGGENSPSSAIIASISLSPVTLLLGHVRYSVWLYIPPNCLP